MLSAPVGHLLSNKGEGGLQCSRTFGQQIRLSQKKHGHMHYKNLTGNIHSMCMAPGIVHNYMSQGWGQGKQLEKYHNSLKKKKLGVRHELLR